MKDFNYVRNCIYIFILFFIIISLASFLIGCSPTAIRISEEVVEDVLEEELKGK